MNIVKLFLIIFSLSPLSASHFRIDQGNERQFMDSDPILVVHGRGVAESDPELFELQRLWAEWDYCTNAVPSQNFTEMTEVVPEGVVFLANYIFGSFKSDNATCIDPITRIGTINTGLQKILMPVWNTLAYDYADDYLLGICANSSAESEAARFTVSEENAWEKKDPNNTQFIVLKVDNISLEPFFLYDNRTYYLKGCPDNRTYEEYNNLTGESGDSCDADPFQRLNGLDAYPLFGWWGMYNHTWQHDETHSFEFGVTGDVCNSVKYVLTAKNVNSAAHRLCGNAVALSMIFAAFLAISQLW